MNKDDQDTRRKILKEIGSFLEVSVCTVYKKCGKNCTTYREKEGHPATYFCYRRRGKTLVAHIPSSKVDLARNYHTKYKILDQTIEDMTEDTLEKIKRGKYWRRGRNERRNQGMDQGEGNRRGHH